MSVPKENIWQDIRRSCLDAIPAGSVASPMNRIGLRVWQEQGTYTVQATNAKRFELATFPDEIGSALLTESECLLDNAAEHQVSLWRYIHSSEWLSPAWTAVTFYYWSFYLCLAITRLTGRTVWFISAEIAKNLRILGPPSSAAPGGGSYVFICDGPISATQRKVILEKTGGRIHDEIWRTWFASCDARVKRFSVGSSASLEERLFTAVARSARQLGSDWPSAARNAINYRTGFAYGAVRRDPVLKSFRA